MLSVRFAVSAACCYLCACTSFVRAAEPVDFERDIAPILLTRCVECHNDTEASGGLNLTSLEAITAGSDSGVTLSAGHPEDSYLWQRVSDGDMPPEKQGQPQTLPAAEAELLNQWIASGANWPQDRKLDLFEKTNAVRGGRDWWSLQPVTSPEIPAVDQLSEDGNAIDNFIYAELNRQNLTPAPPAKSRQLLRRLYYDLIGLPPTAEQLADFEANPSLTAYEQQVDELLASPQFGERWARYWLDLARFAETSGYERDQEKEYVWKYRDYVINAINEDKPYDDFILEQLAGDELPNRTEETVIATGFLRLGTWNDEPNDPQEYKYERLEDMVHATSSAFLGLTVKCARCHDHKFDPIAQVDYYRMASCFWAGPIEPRDSKLLGGPTSEELGVDRVFGWTDLGREVSDLHLLKKGEAKHPAEVVEPAHLSFLPALAGPFDPPAENATTTERRLQLARWIVDEQNPLTPRVVVNRLWQHHFGAGLVRSPNNFGFTGDQPTHPQLLDWLATELMKNEWKQKPLHKLMVMSATYRQSSLHPQYEDHATADFTNRYWWRANRRRLDAEAFRDSLVTASGKLDLSEIGGESFKPTIPAEALEGLSKKGAAFTPSPRDAQNRRGLYIYSQRTLLDPLLMTFDYSDTTLPCAERDVTTVAPQALALLNNEFVHSQSEELAKRIAAQSDDLDNQIELAWRWALGRNPTDTERATAREHVLAQRQEFEEHEESELNIPLFTELPQQSELVLHLRADRGVELDDDHRVKRWVDFSPDGHDGIQTIATARPLLVSSAINDQPALRFTGNDQFLELEGQVLDDQHFSIFAIVRDENTGTHREIFSNWNGREGNSTTSVFLGSTGAGTIRLSDDFAASPPYPDSSDPFLVVAINSQYDASIILNATHEARKNSPLAPRNLSTPYVIGQQGNIDGEFWKGDIAEIIVYNRALDDVERQQVEQYLMQRYQLTPEVEKLPPNLLALASLCHVLFNSNEFMFVD